MVAGFPVRVRSWRQVHKLYDALRARYFMGAESPLRVPPPAAEMQWYWIPSKSGHHGLTHLDEEQDGEAVGINQDLRRSTRFLTTILLHELTHLRDPRLKCSHQSPGWRAEQVRLSSLGAPLL